MLALSLPPRPAAKTPAPMRFLSHWTALAGILAFMALPLSIYGQQTEAALQLESGGDLSWVKDTHKAVTLPEARGGTRR